MSSRAMCGVMSTLRTNASRASERRFCAYSASPRCRCSARRLGQHGIRTIHARLRCRTCWAAAHHQTQRTASRHSAGACGSGASRTRRSASSGDRAPGPWRRHKRHGAATRSRRCLACDLETPLRGSHASVSVATHLYVLEEGQQPLDPHRSAARVPATASGARAL